MSIGIWQIAIVVILVVLLFGRGKISSLMGDVAKGIKSFKKGMASDVTDDSEPKNISDDNKDSNNSHRDSVTRVMNSVKGLISASMLSYLSMFVVMGGVVSSISTYLVISGLTPVTPTEWVFKLLIFINCLAKMT